MKPEIPASIGKKQAHIAIIIIKKCKKNCFRAIRKVGTLPAASRRRLSLYNPIELLQELQSHG